MALSFKPSCLFIFLVYIVCTAHSRHAHSPHHHRHQRRDAFISTSASSSTSSSGTEVAQLVGDVTAIEEGLMDLPQDVFDFLEEIDARLHQQEALLESLLAALASATEAVSPLPNSTSATEILLPSTTSAEVSVSVLPEISSSSPTVSSCHHGGAGPLVLCSTSQIASSPPRSFVTRTSTRTTYLHVTHSASHQATPFLNTTTLPPPEISSTSIPMLPNPPSYSYVATAPVAGSSGVNASETVAVTSSAPSASGTGYVFETNRKSNVAVYYGQTPTTKTGDLMELCQNDNVDIVVLSFVTSFFINSGFPSASFGPGCTGSTTAQQLHAPGLQNCTDLAPEIASCQALGKPVLVSLGGYYANVTFTSDDGATQLAQTLWDLFGAGTGLDADLRPFGPSIIVDGFDLDNESHDPTSYGTFAKALRTLFASDISKQYYLSAAPQCPRPDASIPLDAMAVCDFVFVQFYNNPSCDLSGSGFQDSFAAWSEDLAKLSNTTKLYIGAPGFEGAGSGYVEGDGLAHVVSLARELYVSNLGGIMLWDGTEALSNVDQYDDDYLLYAKASLE